MKSNSIITDLSRVFTLLIALTASVFAWEWKPDIPPATPLIDCPRNENFEFDRTDDARGCKDKNGNQRCFSRRHYPCAGVHDHGYLTYQEERRGECVKVRRKAVRCQGSFQNTTDCGSASTVECGDGGDNWSGIYEG